MNLGAPEILLILLVVLLLFGAKRLPDMARSLGRSMRIFKAETRAMSEESGPRAVDRAAASAADSAVGPADASPPVQPSAAPVADPQVGGEQR